MDVSIETGLEVKETNKIYNLDLKLATVV